MSHQECVSILFNHSEIFKFYRELKNKDKEIKNENERIINLPESF